MKNSRIQLRIEKKLKKDFFIKARKLRQVPSYLISNFIYVWTYGKNKKS